MGSIGAASKRNEEQEGEKGLLISPTSETTAPQSRGPATLNQNSTAVNQVDRVEQLLSQLEARSVALVPYGYWNQPPANRSNNWIIAAMLGCVWLSSLTLAFAYFSYGPSTQTAEHEVPASPLVITPPSDQQDQKTAASFNQLTKALADSSNRLKHIEAALQKSKLDLRQFRTKVGSDGDNQAQIRQPQTAPVEGNQAAYVTDSTPEEVKQNVGIPPNQTDGSGSKTTPKTQTLPAALWSTYHGLLVKPTNAAVPHRAADGTIDYWLVRRGASQQPHKVQPIAITQEGIVIYCLEDGKKYTVTRKGEWRNAK